MMAGCVATLPTQSKGRNSRTLHHQQEQTRVAGASTPELVADYVITYKYMDTVDTCKRVELTEQATTLTHTRNNVQFNQKAAVK